ncbi:hypothetical protein niasHT_004048 [Heterodera trifolii]|uniref:Uncharacterized protein n=1 Tax=Heterodera trifolii TaxID=157864 RepID=A0ABD2LXR2_9BILA
MPLPCHIFTLGDEICVLNSEGMFSKLVEESVENKLDILLKKNLFDLAINFARRGKSEEMLKSIFMKYGDYFRSLKYRSAPLSGCLFAGC